METMKTYSQGGADLTGFDKITVAAVESQWQGHRGPREICQGAAERYLKLALGER